MVPQSAREEAYRWAREPLSRRRRTCHPPPGRVFRESQPDRSTPEPASKPCRKPRRTPRRLAVQSTRATAARGHARPRRSRGSRVIPGQTATKMSRIGWITALRSGQVLQEFCFAIDPAAGAVTLTRSRAVKPPDATNPAGGVRLASDSVEERIGTTAPIEMQLPRIVLGGDGDGASGLIKLPINEPGLLPRVARGRGGDGHGRRAGQGSPVRPGPWVASRGVPVHRPRRGPWGESGFGPDNAAHPARAGAASRPCLST
jgi:hypothetical protein